MVVLRLFVLLAHLVALFGLRLSEPIGDTSVLAPNLHPKFVGSKSRVVNGCNRVASSWCHPKERDSAQRPECHAKLHELASSIRVDGGEMLIIGNGLEEIGDIKVKLGIDTIAQAPAAVAELRARPHKSARIVLFNYYLHHAADDTIALLQAANSLARDYVIIAEDVKTMRPRDWKLEFEDDTSGTHRGDEEWKALFELLGMQIVVEEQPTCMPVEYPVSRKLYVLKPNHKVTPVNMDRTKRGVVESKLPFAAIWDCVNTDFIEWLDHSNKEDMKVLDVGGGRARLKKAMAHKATPRAHVTQGKSYDFVKYECVDFNPTAYCPEFDGRSLANFTDSSYHSVMFHSTLHHAADTTLSLLRDARRVAQKYVIVAEDLKADRNADYQLKWIQHHHDPHGTFRGDAEWKAIFELLDLRIVHEAGPRLCGDNMDVGRQLYILEVPTMAR